MQEQLVPSCRAFRKDTDSGQSLQVPGGCLPAGDPSIHHVADAAVGLLENQIQQFAAVDFRQRPPDMSGR